MTWSLTPVELPRAGATSKPYDYQQNVQKMQDLSKTFISTRKQFEDFRRRKEQKHYPRPFKKTPVGHQNPKAIN